MHAIRIELGERGFWSTAVYEPDRKTPTAKAVQAAINVIAQDAGLKPKDVGAFVKDLKDQVALLRIFGVKKNGSPKSSKCVSNYPMQKVAE